MSPHSQGALGSRSEIRLKLTLHPQHPLVVVSSSLLLGRELLSNARWDDASRIKVRVGGHHSLDSLEVSNGRSVSAANEGLSVTCETSFNHRDHLVPVVSEPLLSTCFIKLTTLEGWEEPASELWL